MGSPVGWPNRTEANRPHGPKRNGRLASARMLSVGPRRNKAMLPTIRAAAATATATAAGSGGLRIAKRHAKYPTWKFAHFSAHVPR